MKKRLCAILTAALLFFLSVSCSSSKVEYLGYYTATLHIGENPIPCIAYIDEGVSSKDLFVYKLYFPYEAEYNRLDIPFNSEEYPIRFDLGDDWAVTCVLEIGEAAPEDLLNWLPYTSLASYGDFCGDRTTREFHFSDCPNASSIPRSQLVFFRSDNEACVLKFYPCPDCRERF